MRLLVVTVLLAVCLLEVSGQGRQRGPEVDVDLPSVRLPGVHVGLGGLELPGLQRGGRRHGRRQGRARFTVDTKVPVASLIQYARASGSGVISVGINGLEAAARQLGAQVSWTQLLAFLRAQKKPRIDTRQLRAIKAVTIQGLRAQITHGAGKTVNKAVDTVNKLITLTLGLLVEILKQVATFCKQYLPQVSSTIVTFLNALLPSIVDALVGCTPQVIQLIGMLIAECPQDPKVDNSTQNATAPGQGAPAPHRIPFGPGPVQLPPRQNPNLKDIVSL